jgi:hypothetical protein
MKARPMEAVLARCGLCASLHSIRNPLGCFFLDGKNNQKLKEHRLESWEQDVS